MFAGNCEPHLHPGSYCTTNGILEPVAEDKAEFSLNLSSFFEAVHVRQHQSVSLNRFCFFRSGRERELGVELSLNSFKPLHFFVGGSFNQHTCWCAHDQHGYENTHTAPEMALNDILTASQS